MRNFLKFLELVSLIILFIVSAGIFLIPAYFMIIETWAAIFGFFVSWIPALVVLQIGTAIVELIFED